MTLHVAVDFGTSSTCTTVSVDGGSPEVVVIDGRALVPSAVFAGTDGTLFVGREAERQAAVDPARFEPHPKRRIDEGQLLLGSRVLGVPEVIRAILLRAVGEARRYAGGAAVDLLVLAHPADWGATRTWVLSQAASGLTRELALIPEPVAAAVLLTAVGTGSEDRRARPAAPMIQTGQRIPDGGALAVLDLGGGTVDASAMRRNGTTFRVLATRGDPSFGGADIDQALLQHVGTLVSGVDPAGWRRLVEARDMPDRRRRQVIRQDIREAKEVLSRQPRTDVPMPPPFAEAHITREVLQGLVKQPLARAAELVSGTLHDAGVPRKQLFGVFLVGGSSRIPLVARLVHERTGVAPTTLDQPEAIVARGALRAVALDIERVGGLPPAASEERTRLHVPSNAAAPTVRRPPSRTPSPPEPGRMPLHSGPGTPQSGGSGGGVSGSRRPLWWLIGSAAAMVLACMTALAVLFWPAGGAATADQRNLAQYDYQFRYPANWEQRGGDSKHKRVQVSPTGSARGADLIAVQQGRLDYNATADRRRAVADLFRQFRRDNTRRQFSGFEPGVEYAGKRLAHYVQHKSSATVDWYVEFHGQYQFSVGCQHTEAGRARVDAVCKQVVGSLASN